MAISRNDVMGVLNPGDDRSLYTTDDPVSSVKYPVTMSNDDPFVGAFYVYQGQVVNESLLEWPIYFLPVFVQPRADCLVDAKPEEPNLLAIPMTTEPRRLLSFAGSVDYRIYIDVLRPCEKMVMDGTIFTVQKVTGFLSLVVARSDRVGIGDILFVTEEVPTTFNTNEDVPEVDPPTAIRFFTVVGVDPVRSGDINPRDVTGDDDAGETYSEIRMKPFRRPPETLMMSVADKAAVLEPFHLPPSIGLVGWIDHILEDGVDPYVVGTSRDEQAMIDADTDAAEDTLALLTRRILEQNDAIEFPARLHMAGICAPIQPTQFEAWKSIINATVLVNGNVSAIVDAQFYDLPWKPGDKIEMQLGVPRANDKMLLEFNDTTPPIVGGIRLELRYCRPGTPQSPRWTSIAWHAVAAKFIVEEKHPYHSAALIALRCGPQHQG
jgi:hypothetical protein